MNPKSVVTFLLLALAVSLPALAQATPDVSIVNAVNAAIESAAGQLILPQAIIWLSSLMALQFVITNFGLLKSGADIEAVIGKLIGSLAWFSVCFYLLDNGPEFINSVGNGLLNKFAPNLPGPGSIIAATLGICSTLLAAIVITGTSVVGTGNGAVANVLIIVLITVFSIGMYMAIKILMITLELALVVMLSPLSFSLLGLNALKDQGIAPLKSLISLAYRIILLGILCAAFSEIVNVAGANLQPIAWRNPTQWGKALEIILSMICAFPVIAYFVFKSDGIAATLASGSTNMGPADVASAAAMGAAAGAAIATGGASVAAQVPQTMGEIMKSIANSGGAVSNASSNGAGPVPVGLAPVSPSASLGSSGQSASNKPPTRPAPANTAMNSRSAVGAAPVSSSGSSAPTNTDAAGGTALAPTDNSDAPASTDTTPDAGTGTGAASASQDLTAAPSASNKPPMRPASSNTANSPSPGGSGANAGIGAPPSQLEKQLGDLVEALNKPKEKKSSMDHLSELNQHIAREQASTHVSINTHNLD